MKTNVNTRTGSRNSARSGRIRTAVKSIMLANSELKGFVVSYNSSTVTTTGTVYDITNSIVNGDSTFQRDGSQIVLQSFKANLAGTALIGSSFVRMVIFQDHQNNGSTPITTDILSTATAISGRNTLTVDTEHRYKVLHDEIMALNLNGQAIVTRELTIKNFAPKLTYLGNSFSPASNGKNAIFILIIGSAATPVVDLSFKMTYLDL